MYRRYQDNEAPSDSELQSEGYEKAGEIAVDAGLCWLGDPCYVTHKNDDNRYPEIGKTWDDFCKLLHTKDPDETKGYAEFDKTGIAVSTGYGDGTYPVYVRKDRHGNVIEARVIFVQEDDPEDEEDF